MDTNTTHWTEAEVLHHPSEACRALNYLADINTDLLEALELAIKALDNSAIRGYPSSGATEGMRSALAKAKGET